MSVLIIITFASESISFIDEKKKNYKRKKAHDFCQ